MKNFSKLSRNEMKNILGGDGCCCAHNDDGFTCGMSITEAKKAAFGLAPGVGGAHWCCDSCSSVGAPAPCEA